MTLAVQPVTPSIRPPAAPSGRWPATAEDWLRSLGNVPLHRILFDPPPGLAAVEDVVRMAEGGERLVELVNGTLVEKPVGFRESVIAATIITLLNNWARAGSRGLVAGEQGMIRMGLGNVRMPDVAYFRSADLPEGGVPIEAAPRLSPTLAVEVLSPSNTEAEIRLKIREYFDSGTRAVWTLDPPTRTLRVYDTPDRFRQLTADDTLDGGDLLPGFSLRVGDLLEF